MVIPGGIPQVGSTGHGSTACIWKDGEEEQFRTTTSSRPSMAQAPAHVASSLLVAFGETPHVYLLTRRLERAAALLRTTDRSIADICFTVGLSSVGSFTTSFTRMFEMTPTEYRAAYPPASHQARVPACIVRAYARPQHRTFREDSPAGRT